MDPLVRTHIAAQIAEQPTGKIELFFVARGLGDAWNRDAKGWGRSKRVGQAIAAAEKRGDLDAVLIAAVDHFAIAVPGAPVGRTPQAGGERRVRQMAFESWRHAGRWPSVLNLQREAEQRGEIIDVEEIARRFDRSVGWIESQDMNLVLRVRGFADLDGAKPYLDTFVRVLRLLYDRYLNPGGDTARVSDADLRDGLGLDDDLVHRLYGIVENEWFLFGSGQHSEDGSWSREPSPNTRRFRSVKTIEDYLKVADELARPYMREAEDAAVSGPASPSEVSKAIPGLEQLHPEVLRVSSALFADGYFAQAVFEALKAVEVRVKRQSGLATIGSDLMGKAFDPQHPRIVLSTTAADMARDEQEGFRFLFMGAMRLRNLGAHDFPALDQRLAADYLAFASLLFGRLDAAAQPTLE